MAFVYGKKSSDVDMFSKNNRWINPTNCFGEYERNLTGRILISDELGMFFHCMYFDVTSLTSLCVTRLGHDLGLKVPLCTCTALYIKA